MKQILCMNPISPMGTDRFGADYTVGTDVKNPEGILVRSASLHDLPFEENLLAVARAGAGVNNIPLDRCSEAGIVVFNTPGANANAVKELVLAAMLLTSRKIIRGNQWVGGLKGDPALSKTVEQGKGQFAGPEIKGKTLGVIGLGAIGILVANAAKSLGMTVYGYDPYLSVDSAWHLSHSVNISASLDEIYQNADYLSLHLPLLPDTKYMISAETLQKMKPGIRILNFARGELVNTEDLLSGIADGTVAAYATDFPDDRLLGIDQVLALPHLGASTPESEDNCAVMAVDQMKEYLENGNIINSVNMPALTLPREKGTRLCIIHQNRPKIIGHISSACGRANVNIDNMLSKSRGSYAYTVLDVSDAVSEEALKNLADMEEIIRVRVIEG